MGPSRANGAGLYGVGTSSAPATSMASSSFRGGGFGAAVSSAGGVGKSPVVAPAGSWAQNAGNNGNNANKQNQRQRNNNRSDQKKKEEDRKREAAKKQEE